MLKSILVAGAILATPLALHAQTTPLSEMPSGVYSLDKTHASIVWKVNHMGLSNYTARFTDFDAQLNFDAKNPAKSRLEVTIEADSVETEHPDDSVDFDDELGEGEQWLNGKRFPYITFKSTSIEMTGGNKGKVHGEMTLLGVSKPLTLDVTFNGAYDKKPMREIPALGFSATGVVKRSEFGLNTYIPMIGDDVQFNVEVEFEKQR